MSVPDAAHRADERVRVDVWLWRARFFKTRSEAGRFVSDGHVRLERGGVTRRLDKPAMPVAVGDLLVFARGPRLITVTVLAAGHRRGPASEARLLYRETETVGPSA